MGDNGFWNRKKVEELLLSRKGKNKLSLRLKELAICAWVLFIYLFSSCPQKALLIGLAFLIFLFFYVIYIYNFLSFHPNLVLNPQFHVLLNQEDAD